MTANVNVDLIRRLDLDFEQIFLLAIIAMTDDGSTGPATPVRPDQGHAHPQTTAHRGRHLVAEAESPEMCCRCPLEPNGSNHRQTVGLFIAAVPIFSPICK